MDVVGSVMRFCPEKAPDIFVRVAAGVIERKPETKFVLVGDGSLRVKTEKLIDSMKLKDNFILLGSRKDVVEIIPAFDVFLITSRTEGLPREGDIDSLIADVIRILDSPGKTKELIAHVDEDLEPFSASKMVDDLFALYTKITSPSMNVVFLCDNEPFNIPKTIASIIRKSPFNRYTIISIQGHGSLKKPLVNLRRYMSLFGFFGFFVQLFSFVMLKISGNLILPTKSSHSLKQTAIREHADYAALDRLNSKHSREYLRSLDPDLFISMACPQILRKKTLEIPRLGAWNVHSALLPKNRGMLPTFWSLYHGDTPGVTLHKMVPKLDAGGILIQKEINCSINDTTLHQLLNTTKELAAEIVAEGLNVLEKGDYTLLPNPREKATISTFPTRKDVLKFRNMGGRITGVKRKRRDIAISFDIEEWFQTYAARRWYPRKEWYLMNNRINGILDNILQILDDHKARATFFFLGWIVERNPELVQRILEKGHEIGYHGYYHEELTSLTRNEFSRNLDRFFELLANFSIPRPVGFRAPSFSLRKDTSWAVDEIRARGFKYDSSIYPMFKLRYGTPEAPLRPFTLNGEIFSIMELPLASIPLAGVKIPIAGGAYLRFYPKLLHRIMLKRLSKSNITPVLYFHPWEIDSMNISNRMNSIQRFRQHHNSGRNTILKLHWILRHYRGITLRELSEEIKDDEISDFSL
jgi:polysaccharide deacetylase family protein (PEP-CTERM system associated)